MLTPRTVASRAALAGDQRDSARSKSDIPAAAASCTWVRPVRVPAVVRLAAEADAAAHGMDRCTLTTDLVCRFYGREDLVRRLPQPLRFAETHRGAADFTEANRDSSIHAVADLIEAEAEARGIARATLLSDIICRLTGYPTLVRELDCKEALPLAM